MNGELVAALDGNWLAVEKGVAQKIQAKAQKAGVELSEQDVMQATRDSVRALIMIRAFRARGHLEAKLDPLEILSRKRRIPNSIRLPTASRKPTTTARFSSTMCSGWNSPPCARWSRSCAAPIARRSASSSCTSPIRREILDAGAHRGPDKEITFTREGKRAILNKLVEAEGFEKFIDVKYTGTKRFGLDGGESMIPALEQIIKRGGALGVREIVLGMAHRGRLNVLAQVMGKPHRAIFHEFKGGSAPDDVEGSGDVKYHLGASSRPRVRRQQGASVADRQPVASRDRQSGGARQGAREAGSADQPRADIVPLEQRARVLPLLIHGDAAFAGQGVVAECFGLSGCAGTAPAARCISSSTTRSASPPIRAIRAPRPIRPMSPR
jgi:2-oxoglutarate dehydrogenase E1 component